MRVDGDQRVRETKRALSTTVTLPSPRSVALTLYSIRVETPSMRRVLISYSPRVVFHHPLPPALMSNVGIDGSFPSEWDEVMASAMVNDHPMTASKAYPSPTAPPSPFLPQASCCAP